jgi:hypothetical protein
MSFEIEAVNDHRSDTLLRGSEVTGQIYGLVGY